MLTLTLTSGCSSHRELITLLPMHKSSGDEVAKQTQGAAHEAEHNRVCCEYSPLAAIQHDLSATKQNVDSGQRMLSMGQKFGNEHTQMQHDCWALSPFPSVPHAPGLVEV